MSAQINEHNVAEDAHANRFANYLPLSGGTMTGELVIGNEKEFEGHQANTISFSKAPNTSLVVTKIEGNEILSISSDGAVLINNGAIGMSISQSVLSLESNYVNVGDSSYIPTENNSVVNKKYVDDQIAAIPTPDVSAQIEAHNTSTAAHANMHWLTADDEMLSSIEPDGSIDADTLEGHPASYFATQTDLSGYVLKSELSTLVPAPDLTNYYTKTEVDAKITQIQQLIDEAAALVDQINGEVI